MKHNIIKLLLSTTIIMISSSNKVYSTVEYEELCLDDFTYDNLQKYSVEDTGALYRANNKTKIYPKYDGQKLYDLQTRISTITSDNEELTNPDGGDDVVGLLNLIVFKFNEDSSENIYTLSNINNIPKSGNNKFLNIELQNSTNLIIPNKITLDYKDIRINMFNNSSILLLGVLLNKSIEDGNFAIVLFNDNCYKQTIIIGKYAMYNNHQAGNVIRCSNNTKVLLYPGCVVEDKYNTIPNKQNTIFKYGGNLYLNRYNKHETENNDNKLKCTLTEKMNIIYPKTIKDNKALYEIKDDIPDNPEFTKTGYFTNIYWIGNSHKECDINDGAYHFNDPDLQLLFNYNEELNKNILGINKYNDTAKYDIAFWEECKINGSYGIEKYNKLANKGNYFNVDDAYKLFYGVKNSKKPLKFNTDTIYLGLIGNRDVKLKTNTDTVKIYGDNREFKGNLILPSQVKNIQYYDEYSIIKDIWKLKENNKGIDLKFYSYSFNISYVHNNCNCKNNEQNNNNKVNECKKYNKCENNYKKYLIGEDNKECEIKNKKQEQKNYSEEDDSDNDINNKSQKQDKYLWELCKDGKFRKYYGNK